MRLGLKAFRLGPGWSACHGWQADQGSSLNGETDSSVMYLERCNAHSSFCSSRMAPTRRVMASSLGKIPTTSVRRLISPLSRSIGLVLCSWTRCSLGKGHVGQHVGLCLINDGGELGNLGADLVGDGPPLALCRLRHGLASRL